MRSIGMCLALVAVIVLSACGGEEDGATDQATPAPPEVATITVSAAAGGEISLSDGTRLLIPPGALPTDFQVALSKEGSAPAAEDWVASLSSPVHVDLGDQTLLKAATLELPYDRSLLPPEVPEDGILASYFDEVNNKWVTVDGAVDPSRGVVVLQITHASWWQPWTWEWSKWVTALTKVMDMKVTSLLDAVSLLTEPCTEAGQLVRIVQPAIAVLKGCIDTDARDRPAVRVVNLKSFPIGVRATGPAESVAPQILDGGQSLRFEISTAGSPPVVISADFTEQAMGYFIVKLLLDAMPFADLVPQGAYRDVADKILEQQFIAPAIVALLRKDGLGAAEELVRMMNDDAFVGAFVAAVVDYGTKHNVVALAKLTKAGAKTLVVGITATNVVFKVTDFISNYFFNNHSEVRFGWSQDAAIVLGPEGAIQNTASKIIAALNARDYATVIDLTAQACRPALGTPESLKLAWDKLWTLYPGGKLELRSLEVVVSERRASVVALELVIVSRAGTTPFQSGFFDAFVLEDGRWLAGDPSCT